MGTSRLGRSLARGVAALALMPAGGWVVPAMAQESGATELERIVITGRKRTEAEERAPVSVTVVEPEQVPPTTLDPGPAIARQAPNANFIDYSRFGDSFLNIRGISTLGSPLNPLAIA